MAIKITDECINCGACEPECPNNAIYEGGSLWRWSDGTSLTDITDQKSFSNEFFYIVSGKCTECVGFFDEPQCSSVCPVNCCVIDLDKLETKDELLNKKDKLHAVSF
jgi:ferredoxin